jgi:crotonobetainyl-CoA:carnitine CoA-transferase CaiB-like acyl-CoA transferase
VASLLQSYWQPTVGEEQEVCHLQKQKKNEDELDRLIEEWTVERQAEKVMMLMQKAGVPAGVVNDGEDLQTRDPQLKSSGVLCLP